MRHQQTPVLVRHQQTPVLPHSVLSATSSPCQWWEGEGSRKLRFGEAESRSLTTPAPPASSSLPAADLLGLASVILEGGGFLRLQPSSSASGGLGSVCSWAAGVRLPVPLGPGLCPGPQLGLRLLCPLRSQVDQTGWTWDCISQVLRGCTRWLSGPSLSAPALLLVWAAVLRLV